MVDTIVMRRLTGRSRPKSAGHRGPSEMRSSNALLRLLLFGAALFGFSRATVEG